jgi:hypothetical protein
MKQCIGAIAVVFLFLGIPAEGQQYYTPNTGGLVCAPNGADTNCYSSSEIGPGTISDHFQETGTNCGSPEDGVTNSTYTSGGTSLLLPSLQLLYDSKSGQWVPQNVSQTSNTFYGLPLPGQSTVISAISASGMVTTSLQSFFNGQDGDASCTYTDFATETLELKTGKYTHRDTFNVNCYHTSESCTESNVQIHDDDGILPVTPLVPANLPALAPVFVNPAGTDLPLPTSVEEADVPDAPTASALAADGVSAVAVVFRSSSTDPVKLTLSAPSGYSGAIGSLTDYESNYLSSPSPGSEVTVTVSTAINESDCTASTDLCTFVALLWPPASIATTPPASGSSPAPVALTVQAVQQSAATGKIDGISSSQIQLLPPPLVLVHGLWDDAYSAWSTLFTPSYSSSDSVPCSPQWTTQSYPHQYIFAADYGDYSGTHGGASLSFYDPNIQQSLSGTVEDALTCAANDGFAAQTVDVLAQGMGGLVVRYFMGNAPAPFKRPSNLSSYPVNKLITVGTPEQGTGMATLLTSINAAVPSTPPPAPFGVMCPPPRGNPYTNCTPGYILYQEGMSLLGTGVISIENGDTTNTPVATDWNWPYRAIEGEGENSATGSLLNALFADFGVYVSTAPPAYMTVDALLSGLNDTFVSASSQGYGAVDTATVQGVVNHSFTGSINDTSETASSAVWNQAVYWLLGEGTGQAPTTVASVRKAVKSQASASSTLPAPVFDLTGYTQVAASNVSFTPTTGTALTIGAATTIAATSTTNTISEILLFQTIADPSDVAINYATQSPFSISFTPTRLGSANFSAIAVFTNNTYAVVPLSYTLQPSGSALALSLNAPVASRPVGLTTIVPAYALFANGPINVTQQTTYAARSGGTSVFSVGANGSITTTGNGVDWLDASYGGQTASAQITVGTCTYALSPVAQFVEVSGGSVSINVTTAGSCAWTADAGNSNWLSLSNSSGSGSGAITVTVAPNTSGAPQTAIVTVGGQDVAITQPGTSCTYTLGQSQINAPATGASGSISVTTSCPIVASSSATWVTVVPLSSSVDYTIAANASNSPQSTTITIGNQNVSVTEAGVTSTFSLSANPTSINISAQGGRGTTGVSVTPGGGFTGAVSLSCTVAFAGTGSATDLPTCSLSPIQVNITGTASATSTLNISTTAPQTADMRHDGVPSRRGVLARGGIGILFGAFLLGVPIRRRPSSSILGMLVVIALIGGTLACGGGSARGGGSAGGSNNNPGTTIGSYTVTVSAMGGSVSTSSSVAVTLQ